MHDCDILCHRLLNVWRSIEQCAIDAVNVCALAEGRHFVNKHVSKILATMINVWCK